MTLNFGNALHIAGYFEYNYYIFNAYAIAISDIDVASLLTAGLNSRLTAQLPAVHAKCNTCEMKSS